MTACTICGLPCPGTDDDDAPCCAWCDAVNFGEAEVRPPAWVTRRRPVPAYLREVVLTLACPGTPSRDAGRDPC